METNSAGSRILCSESSYLLLRIQAPDIPVISRGRIPVKGKGEMAVHWVADEIISQNRKKRRKAAKEKRDALGTELLDQADGTDKSETVGNDGEDGGFYSDPNQVKKTETKCVRIVAPGDHSETTETEVEANEDERLPCPFASAPSAPSMGNKELTKDDTGSLSSAVVALTPPPEVVRDSVGRAA